MPSKFFDKKNMAYHVICPSCGHNKTLEIGKIPSSIIFAGRQLDTPLNGGYLYKCKQCHLQFRNPRLSKQELDKLYLNGNINNWINNGKERTDWKIATEWINARKNKISSILDIGCFDGRFLSGLVPNYDCYGIEINKQAAKLARLKGVNIIAENLSEIHGLKQQYDIVSAYDVIEHVENPLIFLTNLARLTKSHGSLIISTGNTDALTWKFQKSSYYYCTIAEHISFINKSWLNLAAKKLNLEITEFSLFSHSKSNSFEVINELSKNVLYTFAPGIAAWLRSKGFGKITTQKFPELAYYPPPWLSSKDHLIIMLTKK